MTDATGSETIKFNCTSCQAPMSAPAGEAGNSQTCSSCHAVVIVPQPSMPTAAEGIAVMASSEAIDPNASPEFKAATAAPAVIAPPPVQPSTPRPYSPYATTDAKAPLSTRTAVMAVSAVVVLVVLVIAGISINRGIERKRIEQDVSALVEKARKEISMNHLEDAVAEALDAEKKASASTLELDPELRSKWDAQIAKISKLKDKVAELEKKFTDAEKDLPATRNWLQNQKIAIGAVSDENRPAVLKVEALLSEIEKLEQKQKLDRLKADLAKANKLYADGDIETAGDKAESIVRDMNAKPLVQDEAVESRLRVLRKRAEQLKEANDVRLSTRSGKYAEARKSLQKQLELLDESNPDLKPLVGRIAKLKDSLIEEEKRTKKMSQEDSRSLLEVVHALHKLDHSIEGEKIEGDTIGIKLDGNAVRLGILHDSATKNLFIEIGGNRLEADANEMQRHPLRVLYHARLLGEAMKKAGVVSEGVWDAKPEAPLPSARRMGEDGNEYVFLGDKLYVGAPEPKEDARTADRSDFELKTEALAQAVMKDAETRQEVREIVAEDVRATAKEADWYDHLPGEFVRKVIDDGYIERNMPGAADRLKKELADWRAAYVRINKPVFNYSGTTKDGDEVIEYRTLEEHPYWRIYDKSTDTTTFAIDNPDDERNCMFVLYDFPGKAEAFPGVDKAKLVRMTYQASGVTATYNPANQRMDTNREAWDLCAVLELGPSSAEYRLQKGFGSPTWSFQPHVLLIDENRNTRGIVTPYGRLDMVDFRKIEEPQRTKDMETFLSKMAVVLPTCNYLHLYFRYFHEYILDSPVTDRLELLGSRIHCGDIHQTAYQSLMRMMGGRLVGDCDDLAELFMNVTRRQGKLSYVMALPQHAACGWVEKKPNESEYTFHIDDTGPPRIFKHTDLDKVIEMAERAYDDDNTMHFDPKSLGYLFRFNNEPTRTPYYLSSRMFVDKDYGEAMERVQSYWHFHFYKLGIETMTNMINKGDRVPENCIELAGLYGQIREVEDSIHWTNEALKQFSDEEKLSRMSEEFRIGLMWRTEHENEKSYEYIKKTIDELKELYASPQTFIYSSMRHQFMGLLVSIDKPWEAWDLVEREIIFLARKGELKDSHVGGLTAVYQKMKQQIREGKTATRSEKDELENLEKILDWFYANALFERSDDFGDIMRKYAFLSTWYSGKFGEERLVEELLKDGPWPSPDQPRNHTERKDPEAEDWKWIRIALPAYSVAIGDAMDLDDPPEKWRKEEAVKLTDAMARAAERTKQFGSLASAEFELLSAQVFRSFLTKDWKGLEKVVTTVADRDWARLTSDVAESFGRGARFCTTEEFVEQYKMFCSHIKTRPTYFTVIYEAYRADAIEQAIAATKVALELNPGDADMQREALYLEQLGKKKLEHMAATKKEKEKTNSGSAQKADSPPPAEQK